MSLLFWRGFKMDVEKMKRINALARELKDHGIVSDFDEAYK